MNDDKVKMVVIPKFWLTVTSMSYKGAAIHCQTAIDTRNPMATVAAVSRKDSVFDCMSVLYTDQCAVSTNFQ